MDTASDWTAIAADIAIDQYVDTARADLAEGYRPPLTVLMISNGGTEPVVDRIVVRAAYPGTDTARAITDLGDLLAARSPDTIVICWEHQSLTTALHPDTSSPPAPGVIALTAGDGMTVRKFHTGTDQKRPNRRGDVFTPPPIPVPVNRLLRQWRQPHCGNTRSIAVDLEIKGYQINLDMP